MTINLKERIASQSVTVSEFSDKFGISEFTTFRRMQCLTQSLLAEKTGMNIRQIQKIENGKTRIDNITLKNACALANALGITAERLLQIKQPEQSVK